MESIGSPAARCNSPGLHVGHGCNSPPRDRASRHVYPASKGFSRGVLIYTTKPGN